MTKRAAKGPSATPIPGARMAVIRELRSSYTRGHRMMEITASWLFLLTTFYHIGRVSSVVELTDLPVMFLAIFLSMMTADFLSGLVHWFADTWGTVEWYVVGKHLIRSFREHHVDPSEICNHDFFETNGDSCIAALPLNLLILLVEGKHLFWYTYAVSLCVWIMLTNQFHKWAHSIELPGPVRVLMRYNIILNQRDHYLHHRRPFDNYYCITTGWMNAPLSRLRFWRALEWVVSKTTGAVPRSAVTSTQSRLPP